MNTWVHIVLCRYANEIEKPSFEKKNSALSSKLNIYGF